jgi:SAM-dependent methyltransferase
MSRLGSLGARLACNRGEDVHLRSAPQLRQYEYIARTVAAQSPGHVLDWGCGFGQMTRLLRRAGVQVTPFDYRPGLDQDGVYPLARYADIDAHLSSDPVTLPFADASFESVLSCGVLEHVRDPDASLEELRRVLRPEGTFFIFNLPNRYSYTERVAKHAGLYYHGALPDDRVYTRRTALDLLERHRFRVDSVRRANMLPLSLPGPVAAQAAGVIWHTSRVLERIPGVNIIATTFEIVAIRE